MKKHISIILLTLMIIGIIVSCKKDSAKDFKASIKDKSWWGQFFYPGKPVEYYAIHFNGDGSFTRSEFSGDYQGKWVLEGSQLTISFDSSGSQSKVTIADNNKMSNIINLDPSLSDLPIHMHFLCWAA